jgi:ABC-type antimicrobial peptide transport system permease subunit
VGIYGVISFTTAQRTHEIGVRMALGAQTSDIMRLVVGHGMALVVAGLVIGLLASFGLTRFLSSLLFNISPTDPLTFALISILLGGVALFACYLPARRATRIDPLSAMK